jgi:hypothetical protein
VPRASLDDGWDAGDVECVLLSSFDDGWGRRRRGVCAVVVTGRRLGTPEAWSVLLLPSLDGGRWHGGVKRVSRAGRRGVPVDHAATRRPGVGFGEAAPARMWWRIRMEPGARSGQYRA